MRLPEAERGNNMIKVSICTPTYNNAACVKQLLDSISKQTYQDYEVVMTDDSTNTEIEELVKQYGAMPIRYSHNTIKLGHIYNWNAAISKASGEYIKIMFSDDWFTYEYSLAEYVRLLDEHPDAGFAFSGSMQVSEERSYARVIQKEFITLLKQDYRHIFMGNQVGAPSGTIYRGKILFDEKSNWASDLILYLEILSRNSHFAYSGAPLVSIGLHGEQYTHMFKKRDDRIFNDYYYMYKKYLLKDNSNCKKFFMDVYIMKFGKSLKIARDCGFGTAEYIRVRTGYLWQNKVVDYVRAAQKKLHKNNA